MGAYLSPKSTKHVQIFACQSCLNKVVKIIIHKEEER